MAKAKTIADYFDDVPDVFEDLAPQPSAELPPAPEHVVMILPMPPSANTMWRHRIVKAKGKPAFVMTYLAPDAREYKKLVESEARKHGFAQPMPWRVQVDVLLYPHRPKDWQARVRKYGEKWDDTVGRLDLDNARKLIYDGLNTVAYHDDKFIRRDTGEVMVPDEWGERIEVHITAIKPSIQPETLQLFE